MIEVKFISLQGMEATFEIEGKSYKRNLSRNVGQVLPSDEGDVEYSTDDNLKALADGLLVEHLENKNIASPPSQPSTIPGSIIIIRG